MGEKLKNIPFFRTVLKELNIDEAMTIINNHRQFYGKYEKNYRYYDGDHKILYREMTDPSKPNNKIVISLPEYSTSIRTGYFSGEPITFSTEDKSQQEDIQAILEYSDFQSVNSELDKISSIYGHAFLIMYIDEDGYIRLAVESPENLIIVHDNTLSQDPIGAIRYYTYKDVVTNEHIYEVTLYKKDVIEYYQGTISNMRLVNAESNFFGDIPVVEFMENTDRKGHFEDAISIVDAIELILSNNLNDSSYFSDSYLVLKNLSSTDETDIDEMKANKILLIDDPGDAYFLEKNPNDSYCEKLLDRLISNYHKLTKTPDLTNSESFGNASGVALQYKLFSLNKDMSGKESLWRKSLQRMLELVCNLLNFKGANYDYRDIRLTFTRALPTNIAEATDVISKLQGIVSNKTLLSQLDFIEDVSKELELIKAEKEDTNAIGPIVDEDIDKGIDDDKLIET